jgi:hypothetical protein
MPRRAAVLIDVDQARRNTPAELLLSSNAAI